jgi:hypothetical protein
MREVFIFYEVGPEHEEHEDMMRFKYHKSGGGHGTEDAEEWINKQLALYRPGEFKIKMIIEGEELQHKAIEYLKRVEIGK